MERFATKPQQYHSVVRRLRALLEGERDAIANAANTAALLFEHVPDLNWAGFYFTRGEELVLGPFQGRVACVRIAMGRGVCGTAARNRKSIVVENVHKFDGHIACDAGSNAEVVIPLVVGDRVVGVLDLDSPHLGRFDESDRVGLEEVAAVYLAATDVATLPGGGS